MRGRIFGSWCLDEGPVSSGIASQNGVVDLTSGLHGRKRSPREFRVCSSSGRAAAFKPLVGFEATGGLPTTLMKESEGMARGQSFTSCSGAVTRGASVAHRAERCAELPDV